MGKRLLIQSMVVVFIGTVVYLPKQDMVLKHE